MNNKKNLGQFFTTNSSYILTGFEKKIKSKNVLDPFAGVGDLLNWALIHGASSAKGLDIDPHLVNHKVGLNDSLLAIPYEEFILTNPPYLGKNKMPKDMKEKYHLVYEDLYLHSIKRILIANPNEGILIIPVNFFSAENSDKLRREFLEKFIITSVNYFTEQVFEDTTYNVVSFHFIKNLNSIKKQKIEFTIFPSKEVVNFTLDERYDYRIGGKDLDKIIKTQPLKATRLTEQLMKKNAGKISINCFFNSKKEIKKYSINESFKEKINNNIVLLNCIDTNASKEAWIKAEDIRNYEIMCLVGKNTSRNIAYILLENISVDDQETLIIMFNAHLLKLRNKYKSLFLTNFRDNDRKRISFEFCNKLLSYCFNEMKNSVKQNLLDGTHRVIY